MRKKVFASPCCWRHVSFQSFNAYQKHLGVLYDTFHSHRNPNSSKSSSLAPSVLAKNLLSSIAGDASEDNAFVSPCNWRHVSFTSIIAYQNHSRRVFTLFAFQNETKSQFSSLAPSALARILTQSFDGGSAQKHIICEPVRFALCLLFPHPP